MLCLVTAGDDHVSSMTSRWQARDTIRNNYTPLHSAGCCSFLHRLLLFEPPPGSEEEQEEEEEEEEEREDLRRPPLPAMSPPLPSPLFSAQST